MKLLSIEFQLIFVSFQASRSYSLAQSDTLLMRMHITACDELNVMVQRRMSQENPGHATEMELLQRLQRLTVLATNRLMYQGKDSPSKND